MLPAFRRHAGFAAGLSGLYVSQSYTYDGVGNRLTATLAGVTSTYTPSTTSNQIASIATGGNTRTFS